MEKLKIREAIVVEGRYDKNALSQVVDALILETGGFGVFSRRELIALLRSLAEKRGLIVLTDSDGAGFLIRGHLKGALGAGRVKQAYVPDVYGKERRKKAPSREGKLGVEGMPPEVLREALLRAGATVEGAEETEKPARPITPAQLYAWGLSGGKNSAAKRAALIRKLSLPERLSTPALLEVLNALYTCEEVSALLAEDLLQTGGDDHGEQQQP